MRLILLLAFPACALTIGDIGRVRQALHHLYSVSDFNQRLRIMPIDERFQKYADVAQPEYDKVFAIQRNDTLPGADVRLQDRLEKVNKTPIPRDTNKVVLKLDSAAINPKASPFTLEDYDALLTAKMFKVIVAVKEKEEQ